MLNIAVMRILTIHLNFLVLHVCIKIYGLRIIYGLQSCTAVNGQFGGLVTVLQIAGGSDRNGYIEATVLYANGTTATGPVCGSVDTVTATFTCYSRSLLSSNAQGTVASIG